MVVVEPLLKWVGRFGFNHADNEFLQELNGISLHNFKSYRCVVGSQAKWNVIGTATKARPDLRILSTNY